MNSKVATIIESMKEVDKAKLAAQILNTLNISQEAILNFHREIDDDIWHELIMRVDYEVPKNS